MSVIQPTAPMERERTLVSLQQGPKEAATPEEVHDDLKSKLSQAMTKEDMASVKGSCAQSGKLGSSDAEGIGSFPLLWDAMQKSHAIAVGKYEIFYEIFKELELLDFAGMVKEADDRIKKMKTEQEDRQKTPEPEEVCYACEKDDGRISAAEYKCTRCKENNVFCTECAANHGQDFGHADFIIEIKQPEKVDEGLKQPEVPIEDLMEFPSGYYQNKVYDKASFLFEFQFPVRPKCHFAYGLTVSRDMGIWRHLVLARCHGELGKPADTLFAFSFDGKCVYINTKDLVNNTCHVIPRGEKEFVFLRQEAPHIRITDTAAKAIVRDVYIQSPLQRVWTHDVCGKMMYVLHGGGKTEPTSLLAVDMAGKVRATMPAGKQGFVVCDKRRPRVVVLSNTLVSVYDWKNGRLQEARSGEHGLQKFEIWGVCCRDEILLVGLFTSKEPPWEVGVYQMTIDNNGIWSLRRIKLMQDDEERTSIKSFCSPKISFCQNRLMLGYKFPVETYRVEVFELAAVENKK